MTDDATPPECRRLLGELRSLRERSGHSLAALAAATPYSKSSWGRYLSGAQPVPRAAVVALCQVAGERPGRSGAGAGRARSGSRRARPGFPPTLRSRTPRPSPSPGRPGGAGPGGCWRPVRSWRSSPGRAPG
ncbi:helix-turn-helix domain-containing protein [Streptomyces sp. WA1-19]|uniref:helix-turn-helix domain-containing protein n=1 Tax=Streptomyces sp. WA1-19 TaxID=2884220 RepID=UPI001D050369|nr:helix-turn-helix transcriptional regulator [Streptomyces sp. WA1-19]UDF10688.1 helix-turn-helix domain-containing protein [Streptomyces sp. WA1-19]